MRGLALLLLVTGCRLGFDARTAPADADPAADGVQIDAAPVPTCSGHDEDGDGFPDACDVCPTIADPAQLDRGEILAGAVADGVGDACDPRPAIAGDYIQVFDAHTSSATATYSGTNGTATWQGDALRLGSTTTSGQADYLLPGLPSRLETRMHVLGASTTQTQWCGLWYSQVQNDTSKLFAQAADTPNDGFDVEMNLKEDSTSGSRFSTYAYGAPVFAAGDTLTIIVETSLVTAGDDVLRITDALGVEHTVSLPILVPRDRYGFLEANNLQVDFDYFIAYGIR